MELVEVNPETCPRANLWEAHHLVISWTNTLNNEQSSLISALWHPVPPYQPLRIAICLTTVRLHEESSSRAPITSSLTPLRQMQTIWQRRWYLRGWNNLGACDRCKIKTLKIKTTVIKSILILESITLHAQKQCWTQSRLLGDFVLKTPFWWVYGK